MEEEESEIEERNCPTQLDRNRELYRQIRKDEKNVSKVREKS